MIKIHKLLSYLIPILLVILIAILWQTKPTNDYNALVPENTNQPPIINLAVDFEFDNNQVISLQYHYVNSETVNLLQITQQLAAEQNWEFDAEDYGEMGVLITQINDKINGNDNKYWQYYVNGTMPMISVDKYFPQINDIIKWKFDISEF